MVLQQTFHKMPVQTFRWRLPGPRPSLNSGPSILMVTIWVVVFSVLISVGSGVCHQIPRSTNLAHAGATPSSPPTDIVTSIPNSHGRDEHIDENHEKRRQATTWTSNQPIPFDVTGIQTFETRIRSASGSASSSASAPTDPPIAGHVNGLKRSTGIFVLIKSIVISWAVLLVGLLSYMVAKYAAESLAQDLSLEESDTSEDDERTALLGQGLTTCIAT